MEEIKEIKRKRGNTGKMRRDFRLFFPRHCVLDGTRKHIIFIRAEDELYEEIIKNPKRDSIIKTISISKSPGIEFAKKIICAKCELIICKLNPSNPNPPPA